MNHLNAVPIVILLLFLSGANVFHFLTEKYIAEEMRPLRAKISFVFAAMFGLIITVFDGLFIPMLAWALFPSNSTLTLAMLVVVGAALGIFLSFATYIGFRQPESAFTYQF